MSRGGEKKRGIWAESFFMMMFLPSTKSCQTPSPSRWALKRCFVRGMGGLVLVRNDLNSFILYSIDLREISIAHA